MKIKIWILVGTLFHLFLGCQYGSNTTYLSDNMTSSSISTQNQEIPPNRPISKQEFSFPVGNSMSNRIGYESISDGEDIGIKSIAISEDWIYLSDPYFNNLKKINLNTGELMSGLPLDSRVVLKSGIWLDEIAIFHDIIFVCSLDSIFFFNKDLIKLTSRKVLRGNKAIWKMETDSIQILLDDTQFPNKDIELSLFYATKDGAEGLLKKRIPVDEYSNFLLQKQASGIQYRIEKKGENYLFQTDSGINFLLGSDISEVSSYDAKNVAFSHNRLVYFSSQSDTFKLFSYTF